jgi:hypothetical protein
MRAIRLFSWLSLLAGCLILLPGSPRPGGNSPSTALTPANRLDRSLKVISLAPSYLTLSAARVPNPSGSMTIEAWVKPNITPGCLTIYGHNYMNGVWLGLCSPAGGARFFRFGMTSGSYADGDVPIAAGKWRHIAAVYDEAAGKSTLYVDGLQDGEPQTQNEPPGWTPPAGDAYIGRDQINFPFEGLIDEVRIWSVARSGEQIRADMYQEDIAPRPGLIAEWPLQGDGNDATGSHPATVNYPSFSVESPMPLEAVVPTSAGPMTLDGACDPDGEYAGAPLVSMATAQVYPILTGMDLWLCVRDLSGGPAGASGYRVIVYLDPWHIRGTAPDPTQRRFSLYLDGQRASAIGENGHFVEVDGLNDGWDAAYQPAGAGSASIGSMEFRIRRGMLYGRDHVIGLAVREEWVVAGVEAVDTPAWPFYAADTSPGTWGDLTLPPVLIDLPFILR